ncbi:transposase family protein [Streptomyces sp. ISL-36]|uniref:transposase family protein n=1 Tax=Streptomyces sp. ISL-36 TaxID=2819182 RepID=UPI0035A93228
MARPRSCPGCRAPARRVHSSHERGLAERPLTGKELQVRLRVRRFFCDRTSCHKKTFVEPVSRLSERCRRSSLGWGAVGTTFFQSAAPGLAKPAQAISPLIVWSSPARRTVIGVSGACDVDPAASASAAQMFLSSRGSFSCAVVQGFRRAR